MIDASGISFPYSAACHERKHYRFVISDVRFFPYYDDKS